VKAQFWAWYDFAVSWLGKVDYFFLSERFDKPNSKTTYKFSGSKQAETSLKMMTLAHRLSLAFGANDVWRWNWQLSMLTLDHCCRFSCADLFVG
jgi:hypothetical protein